MRLLLVVPLQPLPDNSPRFLERLMHILTNALLFETVYVLLVLQIA